MNSLQMEIALANYFNPHRNLIVPNVWWGMGLNHECDLMIMTRSGYIYEVEIKTSKADLVRDLKKPHGHGDNRIRKLYFCIPELLFDECQNLIPERSGIILLREEGDSPGYCYKKREAKTNLVPPLDARAREKLYQLAAMRVWTLKKTIRTMQNAQNVDLQKCSSRGFYSGNGTNYRRRKDERS